MTVAEFYYYSHEKYQGNQPARRRSDFRFVAVVRLRKPVLMRVCLLMLLCAIAILETEARASDLDVKLFHQQDLNLFGNPIEAEPTSVWGLFQAAFDRRAITIFQDQFQPYNFSNVNGVWAGEDFNRIRDYDAVVARHAMTSSFRSSARDALLALDLPILDWIRAQRGFFAKFLWNSLDSADEESVSSRDPSYRSAEHSWWKEQLREGHLRYGVRPFRTDPYAYVGGRFKDAQHVLFAWDARYYYRNFGDHCFELNMSAPITSEMSLQLGTSYQFGMHDTQKSIVLRLFRTFRSGGIFNVGLQVQEHPVVVAEITLPWG